VQAARGALLAFLDSDDEWAPDKLQLQRALMERRPDLVFSFSDFGAREPGQQRPHQLFRWHNDPRPWDEVLGPGAPFSTFAPLPPGQPDFPVHVGDLYLPLMQRFYVGTFTVVVRRDVAGPALHFPVDVPLSEDWECFARMAGVGPVAYLDCETAWQWGHAGWRLTDAPEDVQTATRLAILQRVWGQDPAFLARHGAAYAAAVAEQRLRRARWLLVRGRTREARAELRLAGHSPTTYRLLATLPGFLARGLLGLRRRLVGEAAAS
jgi:hypothetical protein